MHSRNDPALFVLILATLLLGSCTSPQIALPPTAPPATVPPSATGSPTTIPSPTRTPTIIPSPLPSETPTAAFPVSTPALMGTPVPGIGEAIGSVNLGRLTHVAQWGRGTILGTVFTPDGSHFVVGSAFGFAIYDSYKLQSLPIWVSFDVPIDYAGLSISQDGNYLRLNRGENAGNILAFPAGFAAAEPPGLTWLTPLTRSENQGDFLLNSSDGTKQLKSHVEYNEDFMDIEYSIREVYDTHSGALLYKLPDETFYVRYNDIHNPEGCDISSTAMCGNALYPSAFHPYAAAFSPTGDTLTILYRAPNYGNTNQFSVLRIYSARDGKLLGNVGGFEKPIQTFAYQPDGTHLLIAYVDGSIQLWDIQHNEPTFGAWHFNDELWNGEFTSDGRFLLLRRSASLEVRLTQDGSLRSRYEIVAYALSPVDSNVIAIADRDNVIKILRIDSGETVLSIPAHDYRIFAIAFSPDGKTIASSGQDCTIKLWDAQTGAFIHYFENTRVNAYMGGPPIDETGDFTGNSRVFIEYLQFIQGTNQIVGFGSWGTLVSWNVNSGATNYVIYSAPLEFYNGMMTVSPHYPDSFGVDTDKNQLFIGKNIYDLQTGAALGEYKPPKTLPDGCALSGAVSADRNLLFAPGYDSLEGQVCILDAHDYHLIRLLEVISSPDYSLTVAGLALSSDGKILIVATTMGTVNVYQITR
jgi:WD40 repeat protein